MGISLAALAVLALMIGIFWHPALVFFVLLLAASVAVWIQFFRIRKSLQRQSTTVAQHSIELQRLDMQRQAAIEAGGNPVLIAQYEQQLQSAGFAVPTTLEVGRKHLQELQQAPGAMQQPQAIQQAAQIARDTHIRLQEQLKQAQAAAEKSRQNWNLFLQSASSAEQVEHLKEQAAQQEAIVASIAQHARDAVVNITQWPTTSTALQTRISNCVTELRGTREAQQQREQTLAMLKQEAETDRAKAEQMVEQAREKVALLQDSDPAGQVTHAQQQLAIAQALCRQQEEAMQALLQKINLGSEAEVEPQRGRTEATVQALEKQLTTRSDWEKEHRTRSTILTNLLDAASAMIKELLMNANSMAIPGLPTWLAADSLNEQALSTALGQIRRVVADTLMASNEQGTRRSLDAALDEQGRIRQQRESIEDEMRKNRQAIATIFSSHGMVHPELYTYEQIVACWALVAVVSVDEEHLIQERLERLRHQLFAARQQEQQLTRELQHPGTHLDVAECQQRVDNLVEEREISVLATRLLRETHDRIARRVLPITERNMQPLLQQLTGGRYRDVRLTPEDNLDQPGDMDYRIRVWDPAAGRYVGKNLFSGGTRDQCSLALRLAFALATLPQELGVAPGFIFLDEPLSAFDAQRARALVGLLTTGTIAQQFSQVVLISHYHAFDREEFRYHVRMESGQIVESDLPEKEQMKESLLVSQ
jgi:F0F1-type ATP synthase membrane subunit b/b'